MKILTPMVCEFVFLMMEDAFDMELKTGPEKIREAYFRNRTGTGKKTGEKLCDIESRNMNRETISVSHSELTRYGDGIYRSECPECKVGLLSVHKDQETLILEEYDTCVLCGQSFRYLDIETMRERENGGE